MRQRIDRLPDEPREAFLARAMCILANDYPNPDALLATAKEQWDLSARARDEAYAMGRQSGYLAERSELDEPERLHTMVEVRVTQADGTFDPVIRGYAVVFDSLSENLGGFRERINPQAVERTLRERLDVRALIDHDPSKVIGRTRATPPTLTLDVDKVGLRVAINPPDTTAGLDIVKSIRRGDISGMSFGFRMIEDDVYIENGVVIREVLDMRIHDVSVVTYPAYVATQVEVALRSVNAFHSRNAVYRPGLKLLEQMHRQRLIDGEAR